MEKYSNKLINDYIMGEEIDNVEELENDPYFMIKAIDKSGDYKLYNLCSDKVKKNYDLVRYLVLKYKNNIDFITKVADFYLDNSEDDFTRTELIAILISLPINDTSKSLYYHMIAYSLYCYKRVQIEACKKEDSELDVIGMGFILVFEEFNDSEVTLDFFAKRMANGIFEEEGIDLEELIHEKYSDPDSINNYGINNCILDIIGCYDSMLKDYLTTHLYLINDLKDAISIIQKNWNRYVNKCEKEKYISLFDNVHEYLINNEDIILDETSIIYHLGKKLGIIDKICKYDALFGGNVDDVCDEKFIREVLDYSFKERVHLKNIENIMINSLSSNNTFEEEDSNKILRIDFNKKRLW